MRASLVLALVAVACPALGVTAAAADVVFGAHDAPLELGPATIETEITRSEARYTVRYEVRNPGPLPDAAFVELALPPVSAVTGLRYQPRAGAAWLDARLLPTDDALARAEHYIAAPFAAPRGPALVELQGNVTVLRLLFVPAQDRVAVEYTVVAPVCRAAGHWVAPAPPSRAGAAGLSDTGAVAGARRSMRAADAAKLLGAEVRAACADTDPEVAWDADDFVVVAAPAIPETRGVDGRMVMVPAGNQRLVEVVIDTGARLAPAPRDASVVFVIDASLSMGAGGVAAQLAMVRAYLARAPGARFELVVYRRHAARVFGRWRAGADVDRALAEAGMAPFALANGSSLDAGLTAAAAILARAPGPRRVIAFTDDRVREALDEELARQALAALPADAVVHVVSTDGEPAAGGSELARDDAHFLAGVAARWGGIAADAAIGAHEESARARADVFEELVRPRRIDGVVLAEGGGRRQELGAIVEGQSLRVLQLTDSDAVTVQGFIWGRPWQPRLVTAEPARRVVAAHAVAAELTSDLERDVVRGLATFGHVVSDETSLWADDPRWTPGGLPPEARLAGVTRCGVIGTIGGGTFTTSARHGITGRIGPARERPDPAALLAGPIAACASRSGLTTWSVGLELETTGREIVDVRLVRGADDPAFARCIVESAWALALGEAYDRWTASFEVDVLGDSSRR